MLAHRAALFAAIAVTACGGQARGPGGSDLPEPVATASLFDTSGTRVGLATFTVSGGEARLGISVSGLSPGEHGMHIHETGACTPPDFTSAGGPACSTPRARTRVTCPTSWFGRTGARIPP